ncbi:hypothetical protein AYI68_g3905 [Smittium mucronatum]|uniref:Uncharacterized protein n=1 Tax=Smittium mucronatum TaxID=133383 RepID=A0A1R0GYJ4_9FUNG|nr:hypothetical protein AYI68_g3905 [Smittium mucronatum]
MVDLGLIYSTQNDYNSKIKRNDLIMIRMSENVCENVGSLDRASYKYAAGYSSETVDIKLLITSKKMIEILSMASNIHIDSTFKLIKGGFPVTVVGLTDKNHSFFPINISQLVGMIPMILFMYLI